MLVDANLLLYATDSSSPFHSRASTWLEDSLNGPQRVALPWQSLAAFVRISTHPRAWDQPLDPDTAAGMVRDWLAAGTAWTPDPGPGYPEILLGLIGKYQLRGNLVSDAQLAALAIEHGLAIYSADSDFARFTEVSWVNPVAPE
ncbi:MAG: PIN domain-containing protein [Pseudonocardiaceae bacterium]|nr:PIN domain-containing protein [Pseudonocardiaceae bacterium]